MLKVITLFLLFVSLMACSSGNKFASTTTTTRDPLATQSQRANEAKVETIQIIITESFPIQISVVAKGHLPTSCTFIDQVTEERNNNTFVIKVLTTSQSGKDCTTTTPSFEEIIPLTVVGLEAGIYAVQVNGITDTFELGVDNIISQSP